MAKYFDVKVVQAANHVYEVYRYENFVWYDFPGSGGRTKEVGNNREKNRKDSTYRARQRVRRLALANFTNKDKFLTLTFRDGVVSDVTDITECNRYFAKFIMRLKHKYGKDLKYLGVIEFQDKNGRGAVHYHVLFNLPWVPVDKIADIWAGGFVWINEINNVDNIGAYMTKYMTKNIDDKRLRGKKSYLASRNLEKPKEYTGNDAMEIIEGYALEDIKPVYESSFDTEYLGCVSYKEYNLNR